MTYSTSPNLLPTAILLTLSATAVTGRTFDSPCPGIDFCAKGDNEGKLLFFCNCNKAPGNDADLQNCPTAYYCVEHCTSVDKAVNTTCENTAENDYTLSCRCADGYKVAPSGYCLDIDECSRNSAICGDYSVCSNTLGSHSCVCLDGYTSTDGPGVGCVMVSSKPSTFSDSVTGGGFITDSTKATVSSMPSTSSDSVTGGGLLSNSTNPIDFPTLPVALGGGIGGGLLLIVIALLVLFAIRRRNGQKSEMKGRRKCKEKTGAIVSVNKESNTDFDMGLVTRTMVRPDDMTESEMLVPSSNLHPGLNVSSRNVPAAYEEADIHEQGNTIPALPADTKTAETAKYDSLYANKSIPENKAKQNEQAKVLVAGNRSDQFMYDSLSKPTVVPASAVNSQGENYDTLYDVRPKSSNEYENSIRPKSKGNGRADYDVTYVSRPQQDFNNDESCFARQNCVHNQNQAYDELKLPKV